MRHVTPLTGGWTVRGDGAGAPDEPLPARVPGCAHTDLLAAGRIPDPFLSRNETEVAWVGRADWTYTTTLEAGPPPGDAATGDAHERCDLVFEGLDTVAEIAVAGQVVGRTRNMHRAHRFDISEALAGQAGGVPLQVRFTSAYTEAEALRDRLGDRPNAYPEPFPYVRKMACSFGWDWGPTLVTAGIWKPARLERWSTARLAEVRPLVTVREDDRGGHLGEVELRLRTERTPTGRGQPLTVRATVDGHTASAELPAGPVDPTDPAGPSDPYTLRLTVPGVERWWPRDLGGQPLYELTVELLDPSGRALDHWSRHIGFRTVELDTTADQHGRAFTLAVNGVPLFARGVNWIPDDAFPSRVTPERYHQRLTQTAETGANLVRVWGGGLYEQDAFYDSCDRLGLLVWQDFPFACAAYPEEQPLRGEVEAEARDNVSRLMPHPSLALWCGNNENLWGFRDWGWEERLAGDSWGEGYYLGLLPRIVAEVDPTRPYWAGTPWSGDWNHHPNDPSYGTSHSWRVWNEVDYAEYRDPAQVPRFVAEFGWQAPPAYATVRRFLDGEDPHPDGPGMLHHQKAEGGNAKLARGLAHHFGVPDDFDRWHYLTQVVQARAIATGIEFWRAHWPHCSGTVVWQINDCWPVTSWAAIDGDGRPKPLYHELRRLYADRLLTLQDDPHQPWAALVNQSRHPWRATLRLTRRTADGRVLAEDTATVEVAPGTVSRLPVPPPLRPSSGTGQTPAEEYLVADVAPESGAERGAELGAEPLRAVHLPVRDREFAYPEPRYEVRVTPEGDGARVTVTAHTLVRDLLLQADRLAPDAVADRGLVTLLPGETAHIRVRHWPTPDAHTAREALYALRPG
ncbi:glycoside hydrolase family 2 protein [Streptomyces sp. NPDC005438]|uniref:glycoside hydrolase family 2 protein n=1 Tax=Streptomyces sp. NPDC005438 TaxID=3156880 RepID=UPI0033B1F937